MSIYDNALVDALLHLLAALKDIMKGYETVQEITHAKEEQLLLFTEAMTYLRISRATLSRMLLEKRITGHKVRGTWRFYRHDLDACVVRKAKRSV